MARNDYRLPANDLELQSRFSRRICQRLDSSVIKVTTAVKHNLADPLLFRPLSDRLADVFGGRHITARRAVALLAFSGRRGGNRHALQVIDYLRVNVVQRPVDIQSRTLRSTDHLLAN